jgi:predicted CXXCH cytochrome family protein
MGAKMKSGHTQLNSAWLAFAFLVLTLGATAALAAGIAGTKHDFQNATWNTNAAGVKDGQICRPCHAPHNSNGTTLLWNHTQSTAVYQLYASTTLNAVLTQPGGTSKLCLSCHDGTIALDNYIGKVGVATVPMNPGGNLGGRTPSTAVGSTAYLQDDHPIGFVYDAALASAKGHMVTPASASLVTTGVPLYGGKLECSTCHDVHNTPGLPKFLRVSNTNGNNMCEKCHLK